jgi:ATP synthase F1 delta subunit
MIARRYAKALLNLALKEGLSDVIKKDIVLVGNLARQKRYFEFFTSRLVAASDKLEPLSGLNQLPRDFLKLVVRNRREEYLYLISREYVNMLNKLQNIIEVDISSRYPLSAKQKEMIQENLGKYLESKIVPSFKSDKRIIGGVRVSYEGKTIDGTVSGQLSGILKKLTEDGHG